MRAAGTFVGLIALSLFAGCERESKPEPPGPPVPLKAFVLHDIQGLYGGKALWAGEDRTAIVQVVAEPPAGKSGLWEKRYKTKLTAEQWEEVERLVGAQNLLTAKFTQRSGVPDEAHPIIVVVAKTGETTRVRKWGNDKHEQFDPVYSYLLGLCGTDGELSREGAFSWDWRPDGFDKP